MPQKTSVAYRWFYGLPARGVRVVLGVFVAIMVTSTGYSRPLPPSQQLEAAIGAYEHGGYLEAAAMLNRLLYPLKLARSEEIVRAKVYLGLCYYVLERKDYAEQEFKGVFRVDPEYRPDPLYIPSEVIDFIETFRPRPATPPNRTDVLGLGEQLNSPPSTSFRFSAANLLPLGIPQFRNGDAGRGVVLLTSQVALLTTNVGSYYYLEAYNDPEGNAAEVYPRLVAAKAVNIASFSLLIVSAVYGIGEALYRYQPPPKGVGIRVGAVLREHRMIVIGLDGRF